MTIRTGDAAASTPAAYALARPYQGGRSLLVGGAGAVVLGGTLLAVGLVVDRRQALFSYLTAFAYVTSITLGALIMLMIGNLSRARWFIVMRRLNEGLVVPLPLLALAFVPIALGMGLLYPWVHPSPAAGAHLLELLEHKRPYLNQPFFIGRTIFYFGVWVGCAGLFRRWSLSQDAGRGDPETIIARTRTLSAVGLPALALTLTFAAFDWLMSLSPAWFSAVFGVYYFAGGFLGALALLILVAYLARRAGLLPGMGPSHFHVLGKLLLTFVIFWAYIAFAQGFLIWIANKPEEVIWYLPRLRGAWGYLALVLVFGHFLVPFFVLLSRDLKRRPGQLAVVAVWLLVMHWVDVYWQIQPSSGGSSAFHWLDLAAFAAVGGLAAMAVVLGLRGHPLVPARDPAYEASLRYSGT